MECGCCVAGDVNMKIKERDLERIFVKSDRDVDVADTQQGRRGDIHPYVPD